MDRFLWDKKTCAHAAVSALIAVAVAVGVCAAQGDFSTPAQAEPATVSQSHTGTCTGPVATVANVQER